MRLGLGSTVMGAMVVLIEPNPLHAKLFSDFIRLSGHHCVTALSGREGRAITAAALPELVILDLVLPDCDGRDLILDMRRDAITADIPIMVLTAADDLKNEHECRAFGATAFLSKPVQLADLRNSIESSIGVAVLGHTAP